MSNNEFERDNPMSRFLLFRHSPGKNRDIERVAAQFNVKKNRNGGSPALALPCGPGQEAMILVDNSDYFAALPLVAWAPAS